MLCNMRQKIYQAKTEKVEKQEIKSLRSLWEACFHDSKTYMDYYFKYKLKDNQIFALLDQKKVISMLHLNPFQMKLNAKRIKSFYIVGVATDEIYRKKGHMRRLLTESMQKMYQDQVPFSYLMPASDKIYYPYGFRYIYNQQRLFMEHDIPVANHQSELTTQLTSDIHVDSLHDNNMTAAVSYVEGKLAKTFQLYTMRSKVYYQRLQKEMKAAGGNIFVIYKGDTIVGIIPFMMEEGKIEVIECVIEEDDTENIVFGFLQECRQVGQDQENTVQFLESFFLDSKKLKIRYPGLTETENSIIMARIINLKVCLQYLTAKDDLSFVMKVVDPIIVENNKCFSVQGAKNGIKVTETQEIPDFSIGIEDMTSYLFGYVTVDQIKIFEEKLKENKVKEELRKINVVKKKYINDIV